MRSLLILPLALSSVTASFFGKERPQGEKGGLIPQSTRDWLGTAVTQHRQDLDYLRASTSSDDCQTRITKRLKTSCGADSDPSAVLEEQERTSLAISFTICSMISASQAELEECRPWNPFYPSNEVEAPTEASSRRCLAVLHRSPQDWNTYQGYLREASQYRDRTATYLTTHPDSTFLYIAQLCLATRGHQEANRAIDIYSQGLLEKLELLVKLQKFEDSRHEDAAALRQDMEQRVTSLRGATEFAEILLGKFESHSRQQDTFAERLHEVLEDWSGRGTLLIDRIDQQNEIRIDSLVQQMRHGMDVSRVELFKDLGLGLRQTVEKHVEDLDIHAAAVRDVLSSLGSTASKELSMLEKDSTSAITSLDRQICSIVGYAQGLGHTLLGMHQAVMEMSDVVLSSKDQAQDLLVLHNNTLTVMRSTADQSQTINDDLVRLNLTAQDISRQLNLRGSSSVWHLLPYGGQASANLVILLSRYVWLERFLGLLSMIISAIITPVLCLMGVLWMLVRTRLWPHIVHTLLDLRQPFDEEMHKRPVAVVQAPSGASPSMAYLGTPPTVAHLHALSRVPRAYPPILSQQTPHSTHHRLTFREDIDIRTGKPGRIHTTKPSKSIVRDTRRAVSMPPL